MDSNFKYFVVACFLVTISSGTATELDLSISQAQSCQCNAYLNSSEINVFDAPTENVALTMMSVFMAFLPSLPNAPRSFALVTAAMFEAYAISGDTTAKPLTNLTKTASGASSPDEAVAYAAYASMALLLDANITNKVLLDRVFEHYGIHSGNAENHTGTAAARAVFDKFKMKRPNSPFVPANPAASIPGVADCKNLKHPSNWQPLCVQTEPGAPCEAQTFPFDMLLNNTMFSTGGKQDVSSLVKNIPEPPVFNESLETLPFERGQNKFADQYLAVLEEFGRLDDRRKTIAEYFAPNAINGLIRLALGEAVERKLTLDELLPMFFAMGVAVNDAVIGIVYLKAKYDTIRPVSVLQCAYRGKKMRSWIRPYGGIEDFKNGENGKLWNSYLATPPFPGYPSGHAAVSSAGTEVLSMYLGDTPESANCYVRQAGHSEIEPKIENGTFGFVDGVTNVPNTGPGTVGYSPASDVTICWATFTAYSQALAKSRLYGGIHTPLDSDIGLAVGREAAVMTRAYVNEHAKLSQP